MRNEKHPLDLAMKTPPGPFSGHFGEEVAKGSDCNGWERRKRRQADTRTVAIQIRWGQERMEAGGKCRAEEAGALFCRFGFEARDFQPVSKDP